MLSKILQEKSYLICWKLYEIRNRTFLTLIHKFPAQPQQYLIRNPYCPTIIIPSNENQCKYKFFNSLPERHPKFSKNASDGKDIGFAAPNLCLKKYIVEIQTIGTCSGDIYRILYTLFWKHSLQSVHSINAVLNGTCFWQRS